MSGCLGVCACVCLCFVLCPCLPIARVTHLPLHLRMLLPFAAVVLGCALTDNAKGAEHCGHHCGWHGEGAKPYFVASTKAVCKAVCWACGWLPPCSLHPAVVLAVCHQGLKRVQPSDTCTCTCSLAHFHTHTHSHTHTHTLTHTHTHTNEHSHTLTHKPKNTQTNEHTHTLTNEHTHTHSLSLSFALAGFSLWWVSRCWYSPDCTTTTRG